jgi:hypothetical protein
MGRSTYLVLLFAVVIAGCGSSGNATEENAAPEYAATPRKALESWVTAVRAGDVEMMCRLLHPRAGCKKAFVETKLLPHVRAEMRGLKGDLHYGAIGIGARVVIGVVSGESPTGYAVPVARGMIQWSISQESYDPGLVPNTVLNHPDSATVLASGRTPISFTAWGFTPGSVYPNAALWIDSRHVDGRLDVGPDKAFALQRVRWIGAPRLLPGQHVMVAGVRGGDGGLSANAWILTVKQR